MVGHMAVAALLALAVVMPGSAALVAGAGDYSVNPENLPIWRCVG